MTFNEATEQVFNLSGGRINGEVFTLNKYRNFVKREIAGKNKVIGKLILPDGEWPYKIYIPHKGIWDYYIPDNKEQAEDFIKHEQGGRSQCQM